ncbi:MAG: UPF0182 family protein [Litorilinea sp.]
MRNNDPFADLIRSLEDNLQRGGDDDPPPPAEEGGRRQPPRPQGNPRRVLWFLLPFLVLILFNRAISFYSDWAWYESLELSSVFFTRIYANFGLFAAGAVIFWVFLAVNVIIARRIEPGGLDNTPVGQIVQAFGGRITSVVLWVGALFAFFMGLSLSAQWENLLLFLNQTSFGTADPIFNRDVSFFMFTLPIWQIARNWLVTTLVLSLLATGLVYGVGIRGWSMRKPVLTHLGVLGVAFLLLVAWQYRLDAFQLLYSARGATFGAGYTDVRAQLPIYNILFVVTLITAAAVMATVFLRQAWRIMVGVLVVWGVIAFLAGNIYPGFVQRFQVTPNELTLESPYIEHNIRMTREAYDLDQVQVIPYEPSARLTAATLLEEVETVRNVRLWDYRPMLQTYNQIQALRQYYTFHDIDIDRYEFDGEVRQVMLSARELVPDRLNEEAQTWVNRRLVYTHGYGVAASPVAQVTRDGLPDFLLKDLPPDGIIENSIPQIYYGEVTNDWVVGRTSEPEFDYPRGEGNVTTQFGADTGIPMSFANRVLFAIRFGDINLLLNQDLQPDSQLLWRRNIVERVQEVAPFLRFDQDPYIVIADDGKLYWFHDAYTVSNRYPYSTPMGTINYIRNSVKIVTDAYDGTMRFFVVDDEDPVIGAYQQIFPDLFEPMDSMPENLRRHIRYPTDIFTIQAEIYRTYHMTSPTLFYNREDIWAWPEEIFDNRAVRMEPYYVLMPLPEEENLGFVQILPFTPANRENMLAWMAVRSDPERYGEQLVYRFGPDSLYFGPQQVEARINQDTTISSQLALWNQQGSSVIRGNLLVIPIAGALLYVEPLYLQAATGRIPELQRVIVATADQVVMAENLGLALVALFGGDVLDDPELALLASFGGEDEEFVEAVLSGEVPATGPVAGGDASMADLIQQANEQFVRAQEAIMQGDWAGYGREIQALELTLEQLVTTSGGELELDAAPGLDVESAPAGESDVEAGEEPVEEATE